MDGVSAAATVIGLTETAFKFVKRLCDLRAAVRDGKADLDSFQIRLEQHGEFIQGD
jgi:hypothetical protein